MVAAMLTLALALLVVQTPQHRLFLQPNLPRASRAYFEAFPLSGAGTSGPCSTTAPTGAKGEALTFTRASNGTCTKTAAGGLATTGIANGDLVVLSTNQARVEYDSNGVLGLLVEATRTNSIIRSEELDAAAWSLSAGGAPSPGNPVRTANAATAPDGTLTAERVDFGATSGTGFGVIYNTAGRTSTAASWTHSVFVRGVSGVSDSGTVYLMSTPGGAYNSTACAYVSTSWSRCIVTGTETVATWYTQIGVDLRDATQSAKSAQSVYLWGVDGEAGAYATSYIPTAGVAVARAAEAAYFSVATPAPAGSIAATRTGPGATLAGNRIFALAQTQGVAAYGLGVYHSTTTGLGIVGDPTTTLSTSAVQTSPQLAWASWTGTVLTASFGGTQTTSSPAVTLPARNSISIGYDSSGGGASHADGIISRVCLDPSPARCR